MGTIQIKRGLSANLPTSAASGEVLFTTDTKCFYVGNGIGTALTKFENATQLANYLAGKSDVAHTHISDNITNFSTAVDARITLQKGVANGIPTLDSGGKIPTTQIPATFKEAQVVVDIAARNALSAFSGMHALVLNAEADPSVEAGGAEYVYDGTAWQKISELNDLDMVIYWEDIQNKPDYLGSFSNLPDTPETYTGQAGKIVAVNQAEDGVEFIDTVTNNVDGGSF
ncbi:MAG TPA: hypothetical protein P5556_00805 [Candidatus Gastranaerophilales bacterium]|nr:hypothetical protein [Candidatus Gastranaerophilales bacterium]